MHCVRNGGYREALQGLAITSKLSPRKLLGRACAGWNRLQIQVSSIVWLRLAAKSYFCLGCQAEIGLGSATEQPISGNITLGEHTAHMPFIF